MIDLPAVDQAINHDLDDLVRGLPYQFNFTLADKTDANLSYLDLTGLHLTWSIYAHTLNDHPVFQLSHSIDSSLINTQDARFVCLVMTGLQTQALKFDRGIYTIALSNIAGQIDTIMRGNVYVLSYT